MKWEDLKMYMRLLFGAQLISNFGYPQLIKKNRGKIIIASPCPALVSYIEKYYPNLLKYLAPVVSPMIALGRVIKHLHSLAKVVFIGPCIAKKHEMKDEKVQGIIDAVLTYQELKEMFAIKNINVKEQRDTSFDGPVPGRARSFPISGGLLKSAALKMDILESNIVVTEGKDRIIDIIKELDKGTIEAKFLDLLFCEGCINGPAMNNPLSVFARKDIVARYVKESYNGKRSKEDVKKFSFINLTRKFTKNFS